MLADFVAAILTDFSQCIFRTAALNALMISIYKVLQRIMYKVHTQECLNLRGVTRRCITYTIGLSDIPTFAHARNVCAT
jgi:hypothetical protein